MSIKAPTPLFKHPKKAKARNDSLSERAKSVDRSYLRDTLAAVKKRVTRAQKESRTLASTAALFKTLTPNAYKPLGG